MQNNRRQFLKTASSLLAATALPALLGRDGSPSRVVQPNAAANGPGQPQLGYTLYGMKMVPVSEALAHCARIGYRNVEFPLMSGFATDPAKSTAASRKEIRDQLSALRLTPSAVMFNMSLVGDDAAHAKNLEGIKVAAEIAHDLSPSRPPPIQTSIGGKAAQWEENKEKMAERLRAWGTVVSAAGATMVMTPHVGQAVNSPSRLLWLYEQGKFPALGVVFDRSHFELEGFPLPDSWTTVAPHVRFIHLKDSVGTPASYQTFPPGEGYHDYAKYFSVIKASGYSGPAVVEISSRVSSLPGYDPVRTAEKAYEQMSRALSEAGA